MKINEIFKSIQGETSYTGLPCTFIRITGCNLRCSYCDTAYAYEDGVDMSISSIIKKVSSFKTMLTCVTGGEPLSNKETPSLVKELLNENHTVLVETNGSYDISVLPEKAIKIMDIKCPDSNMSHATCWQNIKHLSKTDEVKFVLNSREDYEWAKDIMNKHNLTEISKVLISAAFNAISPELIVKWILEDNLDVRFQLQLHKYIWDPQTRGV